MKNKEIIFWNLEKRELVNIKQNAKYVIFTDKEIDLSKFFIKPIIIKYHGAFIIDYENNDIIFSSMLNTDNIKKIKSYAIKHNVSYIENKCNDGVYEIQLNTDNYYRMLIMPAFIKNEYMGLETFYDYPYSMDKKNYINYVINNNVSILESLLSTINYLKLKSNDILELTNICFTLVDLIVTNGYCMTNYNLKIKKKDLCLVESGKTYEV